MNSPKLTDDLDKIIKLIMSKKNGSIEKLITQLKIGRTYRMGCDVGIRIFESNEQHIILKTHKLMGDFEMIIENKIDSDNHATDRTKIIGCVGCDSCKIFVRYWSSSIDEEFVAKKIDYGGYTLHKIPIY